MIKLLVKGASGKMGTRIIACVRADSSFKVVEAIEAADVMIDFSHPDATVPNLELAAKAKKTAVIGTTGHTPKQRKTIDEFKTRLPFVLAPNTSVGVNLLARLLIETGKVLGREFKATLSETHQIHKKDKPSGTALQLAHSIAAGLGIDVGRIPIESIREGEVVGIHTVTFESAGEILQFIHNAKTRDSFALGTLRAAKWILGKPNGIYTMTDVLELKKSDPSAF